MRRLSPDKAFFSPKESALIFSCALCIGVLFGVARLLQGRFWTSSGDSTDVLYWFQLLSGNWAPYPKVLVGFWFSFSAVVAVLLNFSPYVAFAGLFWKLYKDGKTRMVLGQAFATRDQMNKQEIFAKLNVQDEIIAAKINEAFREGEKQWRINLVELYGEETAAKIIKLLDLKI